MLGPSQPRAADKWNEKVGSFRGQTMSTILVGFILFPDAVPCCCLRSPALNGIGHGPTPLPNSRLQERFRVKCASLLVVDSPMGILLLKMVWAFSTLLLRPFDLHVRISNPEVDLSNGPLNPGPLAAEWRGIHTGPETATRKWEPVEGPDPTAARRCSCKSSPPDMGNGDIAQHHSQPDPRVWFDGVFLEAFEEHLGVMMENIPGSWTVTRASHYNKSTATMCNWEQTKFEACKHTETKRMAYSCAIYTRHTYGECKFDPKKSKVFTVISYGYCKECSEMFNKYVNL
ncbi:hypothetical protein GE21DRAFT_3906 [Neurospora crassa]|nr:hypothetical protein GE21DRAFT_3906 [Neurospora crassa]